MWIVRDAVLVEAMRLDTTCVRHDGALKELRHSRPGASVTCLREDSRCHSIGPQACTDARLFENTTLASQAVQHIRKAIPCLGGLCLRQECLSSFGRRGPGSLSAYRFEPFQRELASPPTSKGGNRCAPRERSTRFIQRDWTGPIALV